MILLGELEFGDFPFPGFWTYITFSIFVFCVLLVMVNLLTGMALMDVQELSNRSLPDVLFFPCPFSVRSKWMNYFSTHMHSAIFCGGAKSIYLN